MSGDSTYAFLGKYDRELLDVLDAALARLGVYITMARYSLCETLQPAAAALYALSMTAISVIYLRERDRQDGVRFHG